MIGIPVNANSVYVPVVQSGCLKFEFDSTYPIHLNGIISQQEYQESIARINRTISSNKMLVVVAIIFTLSMIVGMILFITGGVTAGRTARYGFPSLIIVGIVITTLGSFFFGIGCCMIQYRRLQKMRQVVGEESRKYSSRTPTPCSWRLDTSTAYGGYYGNQQRYNTTYHLVIDIGRSTGPGSVAYYPNQVAPDPTTVFGGGNNYAPPPYSGPSAGYCPQCNALRQDLNSRFCPSCGHSFNKY